MKLGLSVNENEKPVPSLSRLHLSSLQPSDVSVLLDTLKDIVVTQEDDDGYIKGDNDTFQLQRASTWSKVHRGNIESREDIEKTDEDSMHSDRIRDYKNVIKRVVLHEKDYPVCKETACFNHHAFYSNLQSYQSALSIPGDFGKYTLYGEVVTSTSSMLEKFDFPLFDHYQY